MSVKEDPRIFFVILTWNSESVIRSCLESVLGLGDLCLEAFVVDNGSTDGTRRILHEVASADGRLRVEELPENRGTTIPRNLALRRVSPEATHVCVLDSDTVVNRTAFEEMLGALASDLSIGVVGPLMSNSAGITQLSGRALPTLGIKLGKACPLGCVAEHAAERECPHTPVVVGLQDVGYLLSACWLIPRSVLDRVGLFDEAIFYAPEDVDWCLRCHKVGYRVVLCRNAAIRHEYQRISKKRMLSRINYEHIKGLIHYFVKHRYCIRAPKFAETEAREEGS